MKITTKAVLAATLSVASLGAFAASNTYGEPGDASAANRTVVVAPDTKWISVNDGDVVKFQIKGQDVTWAFDGSSHAPVNLARIAPAAGLDHRVTIYIQPADALLTSGGAD